MSDYFFYSTPHTNLNMKKQHKEQTKNKHESTFGSLINLGWTSAFTFNCYRTNVHLFIYCGFHYLFRCPYYSSHRYICTCIYRKGFYWPSEYEYRRVVMTYTTKGYLSHYCQQKICCISYQYWWDCLSKGAILYIIVNIMYVFLYYCVWYCE